MISQALSNKNDQTLILMTNKMMVTDTPSKPDLMHRMHIRKTNENASIVQSYAKQCFGTNYNTIYSTNVI